MNLVILFARTLKNNSTFIPHESNEKWGTYKHLFTVLQANGIEVFLGSVADNYVSEREFSRLLKFDGAQFTIFEEPVVADIVFDRSHSKYLPPAPLQDITFNVLEFKELCGNKTKTYERFGTHMPSSITVENESALRAYLETCSQNTPYVLKPAFGIKGSGIFIGKPSELATKAVTRFPYLVQQFVDTSAGIPGIVSGVHDLRFVIANGSIILAALRQPPEGSLLSNVALGGSIREIPLREVPPAVLAVVQKIHTEIDPLFRNPCYSLDFGLEKGTPYLFEINDRIGFPRDTMPSAKLFSEELAKSLIAFAQSPTF